ncbi:hypothetical protein C0068_16400 [Zhongshania marina]|uniref:Uncharacterized protein n=1 Tax=Zhongshania marina TaxID=2304603 RepID=A0A2S4HC31_9GAMM|nr:hypothetical protein C0068_16400 [Marortus luteolus]
MLPSVDHGNGHVYMDEKNPDGDAFLRSGGSIVTPRITGPGCSDGSCVVPNSGTGWSPAASFGDAYNRDTRYRGDRNLNIAINTFKVGALAVGGWAAVTGKTALNVALLGQEIVSDYGGELLTVWIILLISIASQNLV